VADANVFARDWDEETPELGRRVVRLGRRAGAGALGASVYELEPGGAVSPLHLHHANEELLVVLAGRPRVSTPAGARELEPGDAVCFPRGAEGAHRIWNSGPETARVLVVSTMNVPEVTELVTTGTAMVTAARGDRRVFPPASAGEFEQLWREAFELDRGAAGGGGAA
jgi:uncharacterized cupin superfamily protein